MQDEKELPMIEGAICEWPRPPRVGAPAEGKCWYMLQAQSNVEQPLREFLKRLGYELYYPKLLILRPVPRKELSKAQRADGATVLRPQLVPVFPTYPFIRFDITDGRAHEMFKIVGVYGLQCAHHRPVIVDDAYVDHLLSLETDGLIPASTSLKELFAIGAQVRVTGGPFRGFDAIVEELPAKLQQQIDSGVISELDESAAATIAIEMFGRATLVKTPLRWLKKT